MLTNTCGIKFDISMLLFIITFSIELTYFLHDCSYIIYVIILTFFKIGYNGFIIIFITFACVWQVIANKCTATHGYDLCFFVMCKFFCK
jgi:hypothetical protein